jgi:integration host factor subunit beta
VTKRELVMLIAERLGYTQYEVGNIVQGTLDAISEALTEGQRLEIRNFGVFEVKSRDPRVGRNPRTGEEVPIAEKRVATFKPGKALKELVEGTAADGTSAGTSDAPAEMIGSEEERSSAF